MKTIKIAHLYYDLMNLYGENGNVRFLKQQLEQQDFDVQVHFLSLEDDISYEKYDIYYLGTGSEDNQKLVLKHMLNSKKQIQKAVNEGKYFLVTGNALEIFGKNIKLRDGSNLEGLNVLDFEVLEEEFRIVGEQLYSTSFIEGNIIGFQNRCATIHNYENPFFQVLDGTGFDPSKNEEGLVKNNFYGTYLLGPLLVRNPHLCDYIVKDICNTFDMKYSKNNDTIAYKAYKEYMKNFYENQ